MKIAIEAKDHRRKLSVTDIETIIGKYRAGGALIVDKVVIVCRNGFSNQAADKARVNGIELLTLTEATNGNWHDSLRPQPLHKLELRLPPDISRVEVKLLRSKKCIPTVLINGRLINRAERIEIGTPEHFARHILSHHLLRNSEFLGRLNRALEVQPKVCVPIAWPMSAFLLVVDGREEEISHLRFHVHASRQVSELNYTTYELRGDSRETKVVQKATASFSGRPLEMIIPDGLRSEKILLKFGGCGRQEEFELKKVQRRLAK